MKKSKNWKSGIGSKVKKWLRRMVKAGRHVAEHSEITVKPKEKAISLQYRKEF